jgi:pSer/pThr/pTyr-binding forkhead associated (FHA) protein
LANRPKTVAVQPEDIAPPATTTTTVAADDLESLLHQAAPRLFVKGEGLQRPVRLMKANSKIGRAETADVQLPHESVSEQHAELSFDGTNWTLLDSGSTNGCVVDGRHLRSSAQIVRRNSLISIGSLHLIFLCVSKETAGQDRRDEARALQLLTKGGRLDKTTANEIRQMMRAEASHSIAEIVLRDTQLAPVDWANAVATARRKVSFFARIMRLFTGSK